MGRRTCTSTVVVTAGVFSYMNGIIHAYYTVALAPAIGAVVGMGPRGPVM